GGELGCAQEEAIVSRKPRVRIARTTNSCTRGRAHSQTFGHAGRRLDRPAAPAPVVSGHRSISAGSRYPIRTLDRIGRKDSLSYYWLGAPGSPRLCVWTP